MPTEQRITIRAVDKTKAAFNSLSGGLRTVTRGLFSTQAAVASLVGVGGMGALVRQSLKTADALAKTADKLDLTTESLAGLGLAAEQTGATQRQLETGLQRLRRRTSEAAAGFGAGKKALEELGLEASELNLLSADEQFRRVATAMQNVDSSADQLRLTVGLFDQEGANLVNTLRLGEDGLAAMAMEADQLGIALSRADAAQIERANDAMNKSGKAVQGIGNQITVALAPTLEVVANTLTGLVSETDFWASATEGAVKFIVESVGVAADAFTGLKAVFNAIVGSVNFMWSAVISAVSGILGAGERLATFAGFTDLAADIALVRASSDTLADVFAQNAERNFETFAIEAETVGAYSAKAREFLQQVEDASNQTAEAQVANLDRITTNTAKNLKKREQLEKSFERVKKKADQAKIKSAQNYVSAAISLSTALFGDTKAAAIASIVADTAAGIAKTWAQLGWPAAIPGVAAIAASGAAQLASARSASKGGGGSIAGGGGGGGAVAPVASPVLQDTTPAGPTTNVAISLGGGLYSRDDIRELIRNINDEIGDGANLVAT